MFDVGLSELMVIGLVALIVIGPEKLPRVARTVGALLGRLQRHVAEVKADISREIQLDEMKRLQSEVSQQALEISGSIQSQAREFEESMRPIAQEIESAVSAVQEPAPLAPLDLTPNPAPEPTAAVSETPAVAEAVVDDSQLDLFATPPSSGHHAEPHGRTA